MNAPAKHPIVSSPLYRITGDEIRIVEGRRGNPIYLNDDRLFNERGEPTGTFYVLVTARAGQTPQQVAEQFASGKHLWIRPSRSGPQGAEAVEFIPLPQESHHPTDETVREFTAYRPSFGHLAPHHGEEADYYQVAFRLTRGRDLVFGAAERLVRDANGKPTGLTVNFKKFDMVQTSADGMIEAIYSGGFTIFDRQAPSPPLPAKPQSVPYRMGVISDGHHSLRNDEFEWRAIELAKRTGDPTIYLKLNNANANLDEAVQPFINERTLAGQGPDAVFSLGDDKDYDGNRHEVAARLLDSNDYYVARILDRFVPPTFTVISNHSYNGEEHPATVVEENFDLTPAEIRRIESERHRGPGIPLWGPAVGFFRRWFDGGEAAIPNENALIPTYDLINPFPDTVVSLGRGDPDNPRSKEVLIFRLNMGPADLFHWSPDDPTYRSGNHSSAYPKFHPTTIVEAMFHKTPDLTGPTGEQLDWFRQQLNQRDVYGILAMHPALVNSLQHQQLHDPSTPLVPFTPAGDYEDLTHNTMSHGEDLKETVARDPRLKAVFTGHTHRLGNFYGIGIDRRNKVRILRGTGLRVLEGMREDDLASARHFWNPAERCEGRCAPEIDTLFNGEAEELRHYKATWQMGPTGVTPRPSFAVFSINPEGLISHMEAFYVNKLLVQDPENPNRYQVRRVVSRQSLPNSRLVDEWKTIRTRNPKAWLDFTEALEGIRRRLDPNDTSILPHPQSLNDYPRYNPIVQHTHIAPTKLFSHLRLRTGGTAHGHGHGAVMASAEYVFSQNQIGEIPRAFLLEGIELFWFRQAERRQHLSLGVRTPMPPKPLDWKLSDRWILRGLHLGLGAGFSTREGSGDTSFYLHNHLNLFEFTYHTPRWELFLGVDRHDFFRDLANFPSFLAERPLAEGGHFWGIAGAALTFE